MQPYSVNALCIPDLHIPLEHRDALEFVQAVDKIWFPGQNRIVVNMGDEVDAHALGRWPADPDGRSAGDELKEAIHKLRDWYAVFPDVRICDSNHTRRPWKKAYENGIPAAFMQTVAQVFGAPPGWKWADRWLIDGVCFEHGENVSGPLGALNAAKQNHMSTVIGHLHTFGSAIHADFVGGKIWGLNSGCLIDVTQYGFAYAKMLRNKPTLGCGVIKNDVPYFIPMRVNAENRWLRQI